jgi:hypothetical protein
MKRWYKSLTLCMLIVCIVINFIVPLTIAKPLRYDFTTEELCDWACAVSKNQWIVWLQLVNMSCLFLAYYGRLRTKKGIGKDAK